ncbi:MAG: hypothetical protein LT102_09525 [Burkholderiaceae bacterium]|nr:hypothetical protein [Burkholderiaceae bacterium]
MKTGCSLLVTAVLGAAAAMSPAAFAESCSGGSDHGMDATGNECSMTTQTTDQVDPSLWSAITARLAHRAEHAGAMEHAALAGAVGPVSTPTGSGTLGSGTSASVVPASIEGPMR